MKKSTFAIAALTTLVVVSLAYANILEAKFVVATDDGVVEVESEGTHKVVISVLTRGIEVREESIFVERRPLEIEVYNLGYDKIDIINVPNEVEYWLDFVILPGNRIAFLDNNQWC